MNRAVDRKTLAWIKEGVEETLKSVHHAPDEFAQNPQDTTPIRNCVEPLHRVKGAVEMVGIQGAKMLAQELECLALALADSRVKQQREAAEVLATGMLQLPGYLESLYHGQPDIPLILLPLLNDLRAVQDKELLTEGEFFSPDLSVITPIPEDKKCIVQGELAAVAKKLRPGYLAGLLGVIKEDKLNENLEKLILVTENLMLASTTEKARQLWWLALGVIDAIHKQGLQVGIAVKILLGRVDRQIQRVIETGEQMLTLDPPDKIIKNLLYYIAQAQSGGEIISVLKKAFKLDYPDDDMVNKARKNLYGFSVNLIDSISVQVQEELTSIKDALDITLHANAGATSGLEPVLKQFASVVDAMGMLGMTRQRDLINEKKVFLQTQIAQGATLSDEDLMSMAAAILQIESSLSDFGGALNGSSSGFLPPAEYDKLLKLVANEIIVDIKKIKIWVTDFAADTTKIELLNEVPASLTQITGAMRILGHNSQAGLSHALNMYVSRDLILKRVQPSVISLDLLADAVTGLENFYQTLLEESVAPELGLEIAALSLTQLGHPPHAYIAKHENTAVPTLVKSA